MPWSVSVFVVAFQPISPLAGVSHSTVWLATWAAAVDCFWSEERFAPRVTVHVVVPKPPVTVRYSLSILMLKVVVGKPVAEATVMVVWEAVIAFCRVVWAPGPTRQKYELDGVRSVTVATLLSRAG